MTLGSAPQEPTTFGGRLSNSARRTWQWLTGGERRTLRLVDLGPVGDQLRGLDGRALAHGAAIDAVNARLEELARDQRELLKVLDRHKEAFERVDTSLGKLTALAEETSKTAVNALQATADARNQLGDGIKQVQQTLADEASGVRARLAALPSSDQMHALIDGGMSQELASTRQQLTDGLQRVQQTLAEQTAGIHERLAALPSTEHVQALAGGGAVMQELASARQQLADGLETVHRVVAEHTAGVHERLAALPSTDQVQALAGGAVAQELTTTRRHLAEALQEVQQIVAEHTASVHDRLATLPQMATELVSAKAQLADGFEKVHQAVTEQTASVHERLTTLPSTEQVAALVGGGKLTQEIASTRTQLAEGIQKVHQAITEHTTGVLDRLDALPSTEQIHALVEGGTANSLQGTRRLVAEESLRGQSVAERMAARLDFLQSRSVIPLPSQGLVMCRNPFGFLAVPAEDLATIGSLADGVLPEPGALKVVEKYLRAGGTFVDVGANVGLFSLLAGRIVGPAGKVIAVEPAPATVNALRATVDANGLGDIVSIKEVAAGAERGLGTLSVEANTSRSTLLPSDTATGSIVAPIVPLDEILAGIVPDVIKIDVEGWEPKVLEGMTATLQANPNVILIMDLEPAHIRSTGLSAAAWVDRMTAAGLQIFEIDERSGELHPLRTRGLEEITSLNILLARNDPSRRDLQSQSEGWVWHGSGPPVTPAPRVRG